MLPQISRFRLIALKSESQTCVFILQASKKIVKKDGAPLSELETKVASALVALESSHSSLKESLPRLTVSAVREQAIDGGKKAILLFVPYPQLSDYRKIHKVLVEELEKKLEGATVLILANRTMVSSRTWARSSNYSGVRPRSRTLKAVQEALLEDVCYPTEIVGKRIRVRGDGSRLLKVHLNPKDQVSAEGKVDTFRAVYKKLTNKDVTFEFPHH